MTHDLEPYQAPATPALRAGALDYPTILALGKAFAASGLFPGVKDEGVAAIKILAGVEMGLEPVAAMNGIDIIAVKDRPPRMRPNTDVQTLLAARAGYTFTPVEHGPEKCVLQWFRNGEPLGLSEFSITQARGAGLVKDYGAWKTWPMNMTLARAITQGVKLYCRHILAGTIGGMQMVTTEELEQEYPDPRSDEIRALHATYREAHPKDPDELDVSYRQGRLIWTREILGRDDIWSWNGPEGPESLTLVEVRTLLDRATGEAIAILNERLHEVFRSDENAALNFLHRTLGVFAGESVNDLSGKQRKAIHQALDALEDAQPALTREQAAVASLGTQSGTPTADPSQFGASLPAWAQQTSAGAAAPLSGDVTGSETKSAAPAEHDTAGDLGEVAPADGTESGGPDRSDTGQPSGPAPAPSRRPRKATTAQVREHQKTAEQTRKRSFPWLQSLPPFARVAALNAFKGQPDFDFKAEDFTAAYAAQERLTVADEWADEQYRIFVTACEAEQFTADAEAEKGGPS